MANMSLEVGKISGAVSVALRRNEEDKRVEIVCCIQTAFVLLLLYHDRWISLIILLRSLSNQRRVKPHVKRHLFLA